MEKLALGVYIEDLGDHDHVLTHVETNCTVVEMFVSLEALAQFIKDDEQLIDFIPYIKEHLEKEKPCGIRS